MRRFRGLVFWPPQKWPRLFRRIWLRSIDPTFLLTDVKEFQDRKVVH